MNTGRTLSANNRMWLILGGLALAGGLILMVGIALAAGLPGAIGSLLGFGSEQLTPTPEPATSAVGGMVWHDLCAATQPGSETPEGCVAGPDLRADGVLQAGEPGIAGVVVQLGQGACPAFGLATALTDAGGSYSFTNLPAGSYCVSIDSGEANNAALLLPGQWTYPALASGVSAAGISLAEGQGLGTVNFGWDYLNLPEPPPATPTPTPPATQVPEACLDRATFVADVTFPDNSVLRAGQSFEKIWRLRNSGTCTWTREYSIVFISGHSMGVTGLIPLTGSVAPGATADLSVKLTAPAGNGTYRGNWMIRNDRAQAFGIGEAGDKPFWVQIIVSPAGQAIGGTWRGEYFSNRELKGTPTVVRQDAVIDFEWKREAPASGVTADNFSVRWTGKIALEAGTYRFKALADDGVRLWIDGILVIDEWKDGSARELTGTIGVAKGEHTVKLEYYDRSYDARIRLLWEKTTATSFPEWKAEYFNNRDLSGSAALLRNDKTLDFAWGNGSPAVGLNADNFSARWTRTIKFDAGTYRFFARADDGVRVWVENERIINEWHDSSGTTTYTADVTLSGNKVIKVEYYERSGKADVAIWWERLSNTPTPTPTTPPTTEVPPTQPPTEVPTTPVPPTDVPPTPTDVGPQITLDLVATICQADWRSGDAQLSCPGNPGAQSGYALSVLNPTLDSGASTGSGLLTGPADAENSSISGSYPAYTVQDGDRFRATLDCLAGTAACQVIFQLSYWEMDDLDQPGPLNQLEQWAEGVDGTSTAVDLDLSALAGKTVHFVLIVKADGSPTGDAAVWLRARIVH